MIYYEDIGVQRYTQENLNKYSAPWRRAGGSTATGWQWLWLLPRCDPTFHDSSAGAASSSAAAPGAASPSAGAASPSGFGASSPSFASPSAAGLAASSPSFAGSSFAGSTFGCLLGIPKNSSSSSSSLATSNAS